MKTLIAALGMMALVGAHADDAVDQSARAISEGIIMPLADSLHRRMLEQQAKNPGPMGEAARRELIKKDIEASQQRDAENLRRNQQIAEAKKCKVDCKPRPLMECMKPNYTVDDDVIGCSKGTITKTW